MNASLIACGVETTSEDMISTQTAGRATVARLAARAKATDGRKREETNLPPPPRSSSRTTPDHAHAREPARALGERTRVRAYRMPSLARLSMAGARRVTGSSVAPYSRAFNFAPRFFK